MGDMSKPPRLWHLFWTDREQYWKEGAKKMKERIEKKEIDSLKARIAYLEAREDAMCDLAYANGVKHGFSLGQMDDNEGLKQSVESRMNSGVRELKKLRGERCE